MLWGINERFKWVLNRLHFEVFIYAKASLRSASGLALHGLTLEPVELAGRYWPESEAWRAFYVEVRAAAPGVLEEPENYEHWRLVPLDKMKKKGIKVLPGPQRLKEAEIAALKLLLEVTTG